MVMDPITQNEAVARGKKHEDGGSNWSQWVQRLGEFWQPLLMVTREALIFGWNMHQMTCCKQEWSKFMFLRGVQNHKVPQCLAIPRSVCHGLLLRLEVRSWELRWSRWTKRYKKSGTIWNKPVYEHTASPRRDVGKAAIKTSVRGSTCANSMHNAWHSRYTCALDTAAKQACKERGTT